ncbi:GNAT family N-acetyltransferase [Rhodococcus daqingensis]|uniref:GNAT family N-acetyltransferase n=1 Tax=Rhodococcus daqingensis TaxID=2479363 RepID=A0ABW2RSU7_9NOCA
MPHIRPFRRSDRHQVTEVVNAHIAALVPGWAVSTAVLLAQLEADPGQYVTDPWVQTRETLVVVEDSRVVGAAHLRCYRNSPDVGSDYRGSGEIAWLVCWPGHADAASALVAAALRVIESWGARRVFADGDLPTPATVGIPDCWPHLAESLTEAGFRSRVDAVEMLYAGGIETLPTPDASVPEDVRRSVGAHGVRFALGDGGTDLGCLEVIADCTRGGTLLRLAGWAEVAELDLPAGEDARTALLGSAADWLRMGGVANLFIALGDEDVEEAEYLEGLGWRRLATLRRGWERVI